MVILYQGYKSNQVYGSVKANNRHNILRLINRNTIIDPIRDYKWIGMKDDFKPL